MRTHSRGVSTASCAAVVLLVGTPANAIVTNDDVGALGAQMFASSFDAVVALSGGCTGTLIAPNVVLTARHCGAGVGSSIWFGDDRSNPEFTATVASRVNPGGNVGGLLSGNDLTILTLTQDVPLNVAAPMSLTPDTLSLVGSEALMMGYGFNGLGSVGHGFTSDDLRWGGSNIIDRYGVPANASGANIFSTDFDNGTAAANTIAGSDPSPLAFEATTAPGDSGGPLLVRAGNEWVIAGVLSGGTTFNSVYGDVSWWTGISDFRAEIESFGGVFVPAPSGLAIFMLAGTAPMRRRRRNAPHKV